MNMELTGLHYLTQREAEMILKYRTLLPETQGAIEMVVRLSADGATSKILGAENVVAILPRSAG